MKLTSPFKTFPFKWTRTRKPDPFLTALLDQTQQVIEGAKAVLTYMDEPTGQNARQVYLIEKDADEVRRLLIVQLKRAFITPIDREDLFGLSRAIDDVLDYLFSLVREMHLLKVPPNEHLKRMAEVLAQCAGELHQAIAHMEHQADRAIEHSVRVRRLENEMDKRYVAALKDLYEKVETSEEVVTVLKMREIYRHMIHAANSAEQAANLINDVLVKLT
ncbi:MAG: DUF47 family protein [Chloroflexi bacterium]|nr:DUF47 family protein [Chloroflexota bacterium]